MRTTLVSHGNIMAAPVIAWILCAPKYLVGIMSLGEVAQVVTAFVMVQTSLNWLVDNYPGLADCLSSVNRVTALLLALDASDHDGTRQINAAPAALTIDSAFQAGLKVVPVGHGKIVWFGCRPEMPNEKLRNQRQPPVGDSCERSNQTLSR